MALSDAEKASVNALVHKLLVDEIRGQFLDLYAAAVSLTERHPEQVNNELRNAITHISRAAAADDIEVAHKEIAAAERHIERAKRDAIKIAVIKLRDLTDDACADVKLVNGYLEPGFVVRRNDIHKARKTIVQEEAKGGEVINA